MTGGIPMALRDSMILTVLSVISSTGAMAAETQNTPSLGNPAGMAPNTPGVYEAHPEAKHPNTADELFAREATVGGRAEVEAGKLAARKAQNPSVKDFANHMVSAHSSAGDRLAALIKGDSYSAPSQLDMDHRVVMEQLQKVSGKAFDELYIRAQITDHQKSAQLYEWIIDNGQDSRLQGYAMDVLPAVLQHLESAKQILSQLVGSAP
jgi:putative membrane protein